MDQTFTNVHNMTYDQMPNKKQLCSTIFTISTNDKL
jgi:hypothetical protein